MESSSASASASASTPVEDAEEKLPVDLLGLAGVFPALNPRSSSDYEKLEFIAKGSQGTVYKARERKTGQLVALKAIKRDVERLVPIDAQNEIVVLVFFNHENIIKLREIAMSPVRGNDEQGKPDVKYEGSAYLVFDYMEHDLFGLVMQNDAQFTVPQIKCYMKQLLTGIQHCHVNGIIHRDIKSSNILVNNEGYLKLADFGLARIYPEGGGDLTDMVVSLWYRAPELLLGEKKYGSAIDMWAAGCIFGELLIRSPIFVGIDEKHQFDLICQTCGTPDEGTWPGISKLPNYEAHFGVHSFSPVRRRVGDRFRDSDWRAVELLEGMLTLNPAKRMSAAQALDADYFRADPQPCDRESLPKYPETHQFQPPRKRQRSETIPPANDQEAGGSDATDQQQQHGQKLLDSQASELAGQDKRPAADQEGGGPDATDQQQHGEPRPDSQESELAGPDKRPAADPEGGGPDATDQQQHGQKLPDSQELVLAGPEKRRAADGGPDATDQQQHGEQRPDSQEIELAGPDKSPPAADGSKTAGPAAASQSGRQL